MNKWVSRLLLAGAVMTLVTTPWLLAKYHQIRNPQALPSFESVVPPPLRDSGPRIVYKWRDGNGVWHYADQPPRHHQWQAITLEPQGSSNGNSKVKKTDPTDSAAAPLSAIPSRHPQGVRSVPADPFAVTLSSRLGTFAMKDGRHNPSHWD